MQIRKAKNLDRASILVIYLNAFSDKEKELVSRLAIDLLSEISIPETLSLVAENDNTVIGHIAFSPVEIDNNDHIQGYILAPLAVMPRYQKQGVGTALIKHGIQLLSKMAVNILFVYGDPEYYGRFGFRTDIAEKFMPQYELQYPFGWQALVLKECNLKKTPVSITCTTSLCNPKLW